MTAGWKIALAVLVTVAGLPLAANAGHGHRHHHGGGGYGYGGGYGGCCSCGGQVQYAPPAHAQYGEPTPAVAQGNSGYQSFSYSPTPAGEVNAPGAAAPVMNTQAYYQPAPNYGAGYYGGGYTSGSRWGARAYNNAANKTLGHNDYGLGRP